MVRIPQSELGTLVNTLHAEENPLVKADLLRKYVAILDFQSKAGKDCKQQYADAYCHYNSIISKLNGDDTELIAVFKKRADYCREKSGLPRKP